MFKHGLHLWWVLIVVGIVSIVFHLEPSSKRAYWLDVVIANLAIITFLLYYRNAAHNKTLLVYAAALGALSIILWFAGGDDRDEGRYIVLHSLWHVLSAISCYFFVKSTIIEKRLLGGVKVSFLDYLLL
jgi:uncharacterized membrane protein HdeD (DUF308 family)